MSDASASPPSSPRRFWRRVLMAVGVLLVAVLLLIAGLLTALRSTDARRALIARATDAVREATGLEVTVGDSAFDLGGRRVTFDRVTIAAKGAGDRPFLTLDRVTAVLDAASLVRGPLRILEVEALKARLDLSAPLPETLAKTPTTEPAAPPEIERFVLDGVTIVGVTLPEAAARLGDVRVEDIRAVGSLRGGQLEVAIDRGVLLVSGQAPAAGFRANVTGRMAGTLQGPITLEEVRLAGDGITADAAGVLGLDASDPLHVRATVDAAPGRLFPEARDGQVSLTADLDLRAVAGTIDAQASALPAELLEAALGADLFASLGAAGTLLEGDVRLRLAGRDRAEGTAHVLWREGDSDQELLVADIATIDLATAGDAATPAAPLVIDVDARLVPAWSGRRTMVARVRLPSWERFAEMEIVTGRAEVVSPDVARTIDSIEARFPDLMPALPAGFPITGPLTVTADARGPVLDPELELEANWRPQPETSIVVRGGGRPNRAGGAGPRISGRAIVEGLDLSTIEALRETVVAGAAGGVVDFDIDGDEIRAHGSLSSRDLVLLSDRADGTGADEIGIDAMELDATVTHPGGALPTSVRVVSAEVTAGEVRVEASGALDLELQSSRPLLAGTIDATLHNPIEEIDRVEARLALARGTLEVDVPSATTDYGAVRGRMTVPLGALAAVPALAEAMANLPTAAASGPIELTLAAPALEAAGLLARLGVAGPDVLRGNVDLTLTANLEEPAASVGVLTVRDLAVADEGAAIETRNAIDLRLAAGRLTLEPVTIALKPEATTTAAAQDLELQVAASVDLARAWRIGDPISGLVGPLRVDAAAPELDGVALFAALGIEPPFEAMIVTGSELHLALDPADPAAATANLAIGTLEAVLQEGHRLQLERPLVVRVADRALELEPAGIAIDGQTLAVAGGARFDADWRPGQPATELVTALDASIRGVLEAEALAPYLAGASMSGRLALDVEVTGTLDELAGHASFTPGEGGAQIVVLDPYYTRLSDPQVELSIADGVVKIESATAEINEGTVQIVGNAVLSEGTIDVEATLDDVRYRLDYGLLTENEAWLRLTRSPEGSLRLAGRIWLERGFLRRDLDPDREVLSYFFAPEEIGAPGVLDDLELDLELGTLDGVRIRNNLADLRASWAPLEISGTLAAPIIDGTIDLDPGGYLFAFGQTVRVDSGQIDFAGDGTPATIDLETTTSWEDPTVAQVGPGGRTFLDSLRGENDDENRADLDEAIARGFAGYYGERVARRLSESLGGVEVSLRPILVFGLDNPGTEVTVSRDLSPHVTAALSVSLREEGRQTYIADVHEIDTLPRFIGQLYTLQTEPENTAGSGVESAEGVVAQQRLLFGGSPVDESNGPRLRRMVLEVQPKVVSKRAIRRRLGVESGRPLADGAAFEAQIEVLELLRRRGYPGADVEVTVEPVADGGDGRKKERADLRIAIAPGQRVEFEFRGIELHRRQRELITSIYRPDFLERVALDEMLTQTRRGLHAVGYLDPEVSIDVLAAGEGTEPGLATTPDGDDDGADRVIIIEARANRRVRPSAPSIGGIDADAEAAIAARFVTTLSRVELALGEPVAERRLTTALLEYGYPDARVLSRRLEPLTAPDEAGKQSSDAEVVRPVIEVGVPARQYVAGLSIAGRLEKAETGADAGATGAAAEMVELDGLADLLQLESVRALEGEPIRADRISSAAFAIEDELHARGHARVRVRSRLVPSEGRDGSGLVLRYEVDRADAYRVDAVKFEGLRSTRSEWARDVAGLDSGAVLDPEALRAARRRLYETGLFSSVLPEIDYDGGTDGGAGEETTSALGVEPRDAGVTFSVRERPHFELAYGVLWQSDLGASAVVDAVDSNLFGRGLTLGARARYRDDDRSGRIYSVIPRVFGTQGSIQLFAEYAEDEDQDEFFLVDNESFEINLTASMPLRPHLTGRLYGRYLDITDTFVDQDPVFPIPPFEITFAWPSLGFQAVYEGRDDPVATRRGTFASVDVSAADETVGSDFSYARLFTRGTHHRGFELLARPVVWAQSARLGLARAFREQELLAFEHLFAGGEYSIRGYDEESIGPDVLDRVEEQALLVLNEELHVPVWRDLLTGVLFIDAGNVWEDWGRLGDEFLTAVGLGLRASTPVGLVRLDVAYPLDQLPGEEQKVKVYFGLGNAF